HHRLGQMKGGGVVQADQLAQIRKPDPFAVPRDFLENGKGAAERLHADPLPVVGVVVDIARQWRYQPGDGDLARARRLLGSLWLGARSHGNKSPWMVADCRLSSGERILALRCRAGGAILAPR